MYLLHGLFISFPVPSPAAFHLLLAALSSPEVRFGHLSSHVLFLFVTRLVSFSLLRPIPSWVPLFIFLPRYRILSSDHLTFSSNRSIFSIPHPAKRFFLQESQQWNQLLFSHAKIFCSLILGRIVAGARISFSVYKYNWRKRWSSGSKKENKPAKHISIHFYITVYTLQYISLDWI